MDIFVKRQNRMDNKRVIKKIPTSSERNPILIGTHFEKELVNKVSNKFMELRKIRGYNWCNSKGAVLAEKFIRTI